MATDIKVPALGESVSEATIAKWFKKPGDAVKLDEPLVELETDKVTIEVPSPAAGVLERVAAQTGETVKVGGILGAISNGAAAAQAQAPAAKAATAAPEPAPAPKEAAASPAAPAAEAAQLSPAVRKIVEEKKLDPQRIPGSGKDGRLTKGDVLQAVPKAAKPAAPPPARGPAQPPPPITAPSPPEEEGREVRVKMTRLRQTIARRLKEAQNTAAMLTTFNEVDMHQVMNLRTQYKETFEKRHGVKLGFMGFFVKAVVQALKEIPSINADIDGEDILYRNYYHIGVAVGLDKGLVVPVVRDADRLSLAEIEKAIATLGAKARDGSLKIEDMQGGTFTISNGGVYGSLMSTPILNAPQSGILGMHKIQDRPVAVNGEVVIRPMMYLALTYDHRLVDGREAVTFLVRVKESLEDPQRLILEL